MIGIVDADSVVYRASWGVDNLDEAKMKYLDILRGYLDEGWCDEAICFVKGKGNWRYDIFEDYKGNRKPDPNKVFEMEIVAQLSEWLPKERLAIASNGCEADDLVRRKAEKVRAQGKNFIVISADKDLDCIAGKHMRPTPKNGILDYVVTEEEADFNYYKQVLVGDMTDNIRSPKGLGPKTADYLLQAPRDQWRKVIEQEYKARCGDEWLHALMFTGSLIHIQRFQNDHFQWNGKTFKDYGFKGHPSCYVYKK